MYRPCASRTSVLGNREQLGPCILIQNAVQTFEEEVCVGVLCEGVVKLRNFLVPEAD